MAKKQKSKAEKERSAKKRHRQSLKRRLRNKAARSRCKTLIKKAEQLIAAGDREAAWEAVKAAISALDRTAEKGIIHKNNAARRKSRLMAKFNRAFGGSESSAA